MSNNYNSIKNNDKSINDNDNDITSLILVNNVFYIKLECKTKLKLNKN